MAFIDARSLSGDHEIEADLCIIGAGAAGLAIASRFANSPIRIALLESGGLDADPKVQSLNKGRMVGQQDAALHASRLRFFGGTTNHWTAHVRPLEPIDFQSRPWIPHSGWPIGIEDLAPFYARALEFLQLPPTAFDVEELARAIQHEPWTFHKDRVWTRVVRIVDEKHRRFGKTLRKEMQSSQNIRTYLNANVLEIRPDESGKRVASLAVGTLNGRRLNARATHYVLAAGGIENARLLLLSTELGLGNENDLVGRFFANHLEAPVGQIVPGASRQRGEFYWKEKRRLGLYASLSLSAGIQAAEKVANCRFHLSPVHLRASSGLDLDIARVVADMDTMPATGRGRRVANQAIFALNVKAIVEPVPNPDSRVRLGSERDAFEQRRIVLDWRLSELDSIGLHRSLDRLALEVGASGLGRVNIGFPKDGFRSVDPSGSFHRMGTTRMHADPKRGVVNGECRMHGIENLHVAGSSVFPTDGTANPTLTILALAFRLADRLKDLVA